MDITKKAVQQALTTITLPGDGKHLMESGAVKNILVFGEEVVIDLTVQNPSLQARKKLEVEILKCIHKEVHPKACLLYTSPSPRDATLSRMPSSA